MPLRGNLTKPITWEIILKKFKFINPLQSQIIQGKIIKYFIWPQSSQLKLT